MINQTVMIKICGIKEADTAIEAVKSGAQYIGIMMYKYSKRYVDLITAKNIANAVIQNGATPVAIFVDADEFEMQSVCEATGISTVQLHGDICRNRHYLLPKHFNRFYVVHVHDNGFADFDASVGIQYVNAERDLLLFDRFGGGTGKTFQWKSFINPYCMPFILAGGLNADNVRAAVQQLQPMGVDVSSGVENEKGVKDIRLIQKFIKAAQHV